MLLLTNSLGVYLINIRQGLLMYLLGNKLVTCAAPYIYDNILGMYEDSEIRHNSAINTSSHSSHVMKTEFNNFDYR